MAGRPKKIRTKTVQYGTGEREFFLIRPQGVRVRFQDQDGGKPFALTPEQARSMARALQYAAHHAERPTLPPELKELLDAQIQAAMAATDGRPGDPGGQRVGPADAE